MRKELSTPRSLSKTQAKQTQALPWGERTYSLPTACRCYAPRRVKTVVYAMKILLLANNIL